MDELTKKYTEEFEKLEDKDLLDKYTYLLMQYRNGNRDKVPDLTSQISVSLDLTAERKLNATEYAVSKIRQDQSMMTEFNKTSIFDSVPDAPTVAQLVISNDKQIDNSKMLFFGGLVILLIGLAFTAGSDGKILFYGAIFVGGANIVVGALGVGLGMSTRSKIKKEKW